MGERTRTALWLNARRYPAFPPQRSKGFYLDTASLEFGHASGASLEMRDAFLSKLLKAGWVERTLGQAASSHGTAHPNPTNGAHHAFASPQPRYQPPHLANDLACILVLLREDLAGHDGDIAAKALISLHTYM